MGEKKFSMAARREQTPRPDGVTRDQDEPFDRVNFELPRSLRIRFNEEAARRDIKKRDLVREIFEYYFVDK
jgi:hypothetical protein